MFMHFSMCTFAPSGGCEQDTACRSNPPSLFNPTALNTTQWMETAVALGAKEICLTAHHTGGFALFQTDHTNYSIRQSPYKAGQGDIVKEFTDSCRDYNITPCLYFINAWDCWESADTADLYLERTLGMLSDLMNHSRYGKIGRFWFDQYGFRSHPGQSPVDLFPAAWPKIVEHVHSTSPGTMMLPGPDGCLTPGEGGNGAYPVYNYVDDTLLCSYPNAPAYEPNPNGSIFVPFESDLSIQNPGDAWFYHKGHVYDTSSNLFEKYLTTAGRGSHFILNVPPNTTGVVPDEFVASVTGLGDAVRDSFGANVGTTTGSAALSGPCDGLVIVVASTGAAFDAVQLIEDQTNGQSVLAYTLELQSQKGGSWTKVDIDPRLGGQTIGGKNIVVLPPSIAGVTTSSTAGASVRFKCTAAIGGPVAHVSIASMSLHKLVAPPVPPPPPGKAVSLRSFWSAKGNDTAPVAVRPTSVYTTKGYTLAGSEATVFDGPAPDGDASVEVRLVYDIKINDNSMAPMTANPKFMPAGYADEATQDRCHVYVESKAGRIPIDVFYSDARKDLWVLASPASRATALAKGYTFVGNLGYGLPIATP